ncbi:hypothetical protein Ctob_009539 [Chrysochromulina tobinii]|uniref:Uncharacterized protein n=1 Tax=Chrysochromulina tobinii TaxID=1460289 RepID=A0A0M0JMI0_9EUKA|nr:hypothetical protein Ctob_009539 [Chrysochromulina tobinii]|eukprot:KOO27804.1 hypothetical protein Ctob_009539 [Chrysochromulina sp. CCMP291]
MCKRESGQARQPYSHRGDGNFARSLRHAPPVVDRSIRSFASESRSKRVSRTSQQRPMGTFEHEHAHCQLSSH